MRLGQRVGYAARMAAPRIRLRIDLTPACAVGPGKVALLEAIAKAGSLSGAARAIGMSYRRAWVLLEELNESFAVPLTQSMVGGAGGGGVDLTPFGREVIDTYRALEREVDALGARQLQGIAARAVGGRSRAGAKSRRPLNRR